MVGINGQVHEQNSDNSFSSV